MTRCSKCVCSHSKTDHHRTMKDKVGFFGECEFNDCDCQQFVNIKTGNGETYQKRQQKSRQTHKIKISSLPESGTAKPDNIKCKKCGKTLPSTVIVKHHRSQHP